MFYEPPKRDHGLPHDPLSALVAPRPIGWISTLSRAGVINLAPYSFFNLFSYRPAIVGFCSTFGRKHTAENIEETGEFVCNLATAALIEPMNQTSATLPKAESEMAFADLEPAPSRLVKPPRVAASPCALECVWTETVALKGRDGQRSSNFLVMGEVVGVHIDDAFIVDGIVDTARMQPVGRCGYFDFATVTSLRSIPRPG